MDALATPRLRLRPMEAGDLDSWHRAIFLDPDVTRYLPVRTPIQLVQMQERLNNVLNQWTRHGFGLWAVMKEGKLIGHCGYVAPQDPELVYALARSRWGSGLATEAAASVVQHGFTSLGFKRISAFVLPENSASANVLRKLGFVCEGQQERDVLLDRYTLTR